MSEPIGRDFFGPRTWSSLHGVMVYYTPKKSKSLLRLLTSMTVVLPCKMCGKNLKKKLKTLPPESYLGSKYDAFLYIYIIHDLANQNINKYHKEGPPKKSPPYDKVKQIYFSSNMKKQIEEDTWFALQTMAVTYTPKKAKAFVDILEAYSELLSWKYHLKIPIEPYLNNNHDAFFYIYSLQDLYNQKMGGKSPPYAKTKQRFFSALGEECKHCSA